MSARLHVKMIDELGESTEMNFKITREIDLS